MTKLQVLDFILCMTFGGFLSWCQITPCDWRFYVLVVIFIAYGVVKQEGGGF